MTRTNRCRPLTRPIDKSAGLDAGRGLAQKGPRQRENHQAITRFGARVAKLRKVRDKNAPLLKRGVERVGEPLFKIR